MASLDAPAPGRGDLVGRQVELELVRAALDDAISGRPTIVVLVGDAGVGKGSTYRHGGQRCSIRVASGC